jgi:hypothetical protein
MWERYPPHRYLPHIGDLDVITTRNLLSAQQQIACSHCTTAQHCSQTCTVNCKGNGKQLAQLTSTTAPNIATATGRTFITDNPSKRRFLNDRVRASAVPSQAHPTMQVVTHYGPCVANGTSHPHSRMTAS